MVAGLDRLLPRCFTKLTPVIRTPVFDPGSWVRDPDVSLVGMTGVARRSLSTVHNAVGDFLRTDVLAMFALPFVSAAASMGVPRRLSLRFLRTLLYVSLCYSPSSTWHRARLT